ncbi:MAG: hypothetical protein R3F54_25895 [Alphaproteobacteria bacterium]
MSAQSNAARSRKSFPDTPVFQKIAARTIDDLRNAIAEAIDMITPAEGENPLPLQDMTANDRALL